MTPDPTSPQFYIGLGLIALWFGSDYLYLVPGYIKSIGQRIATAFSGGTSVGTVTPPGKKTGVTAEQAQSAELLISRYLSQKELDAAERKLIVSGLKAITPTESAP